VVSVAGDLEDAESLSAAVKMLMTTQLADMHRRDLFAGTS
jgi:hypothetical protein